MLSQAGHPPRSQQANSGVKPSLWSLILVRILYLPTQLAMWFWRCPGQNSKSACVQQPIFPAHSSLSVIWLVSCWIGQYLNQHNHFLHSNLNPPTETNRNQFQFIKWHNWVWTRDLLHVRNLAAVIRPKGSFKTIATVLPEESKDMHILQRLKLRMQVHIYIYI